MARFHMGAVAIVVASCGWIAGLDDPLPAPIDATADGPDGPPAGPFCYGSNLVTVCFAQQPSGELVLPMTGASAIDTTSCANRGVMSTVPSPLCVFAGSDISVGDLTATGSAALVLVATGTITVNGALDVSTHAGGAALGAGADFKECTHPTPAGSDGGGAGGSYTDSGGNGGRGGGLAGSAIGPSPFHAGCPGQDGEGAQLDNLGHGGGAVYLIASQITIASTGAILADGGGGGGGGATSPCLLCGGGGGGTGGTIGLDAPTVTVSGGASVCAVGGGGGEGAGGGSGGGADGLDGNSCTGGAGGTTVGSAGGGSGGAGGGPGAAGNGNGSATTGGGGGGGSYGAIRIFAQTRNVDPQAEIIPMAP